MAPLTDPERLAAYRDAAANWRFEGFIEFDLPKSAHQWLRSKLDGLTIEGIVPLIAGYVLDGGEIDEVKERRELWQDHFAYHYDLRIPIQGRLVYIETGLLFSPPFRPDESSILVVNIHDP